MLRYGVAPDHISIKRAELTLSDAASYPNFKYFGNTLIKNQDIQQLKDRYSGVIYAYGASGNSRPEWVPELIPEEFDDSVKYAREIVYWYNNHPNYEKHKINLDGVKNVAIIGNGNVAIDVARIFLR